MAALPSCHLEVRKEREDDSRLLTYANEKRLKNEFNDITIGVGSQRIPANRMVLACFSGYFEDKFLIEADYNQSVSITDMDEVAVVKLIEFIYTKRIVINNENIVTLFVTAVKLRVKSAIRFCLEYFQAAINVENWCFILDVANLNDVDVLKAAVYSYIGENFNQISQSGEFKELSSTDVSSCISNIDRCKTSERFLYDAIITWTKHNEEKREQDFSQLFLQLNVNRLPRKYLLQVVAEESLVKNNHACYKLVMERLTYFMKATNLSNNDSNILSLGGGKTASKVFEVFSLFEDCPKTYPDLPMALQCHSSVHVEKAIFCIGGVDVPDNKVTNKVWQMDLKQKSLKWTESASMDVKRRAMGAALFNGILVVAGGYDDSSILKSTEVYMKPFNRWDAISPLNQSRACHSAVACSDWLYVLGGIGSKVLSSVERLPTLDGKWELIQSMQTPRGWFAAVSARGRIYAIGGISRADHCVSLKSVEQFNPDTMKWKYVKDLNIERHSHSACVLDDKIYVVGGIGDFRDNIECYDPAKDEWTVVGDTNEELFNHSLVTL